MPRRSNATEVRIKDITARLTPALTLLSEVGNTFGTPFIQPIVKTAEALIAGIKVWCPRKQSSKRLIKEHRITLQKIYTFIGIQQDGNKIKQFFRQSEVNGLLKDCYVGLVQAMEVFKIQMGRTVLNDIVAVLALTGSDAGDRSRRAASVI
ncbi:hypothetical protein C8F04DRAFT_1328104 [Mycena alexandri]|uniref:Uncharacterized protein n=1 Tax=Mycena alexandri TaxID=1745969 RepID=A0AAD6T1M7_9AGAR|nr:hypothetical protein C8F04DRAFT_1328104 [Mycena alexandri]